MSKYMILPRDRDIRHIDLDEGELCHWKYIKREKLPNGKWRYYYDYGQSQLADYNWHKKQYDSASARYDKSSDAMMNFYKNSKSNSMDPKTWIKTAKKYSSEAAKDRELYESWQKKYAEANSELMKTPVGKMYKFNRTVKSGAERVKWFFEDLFD